MRMTNNTLGSKKQILCADGSPGPARSRGLDQGDETAFRNLVAAVSERSVAEVAVGRALSLLDGQPGVTRFSVVNLY
jgi:hypothetical protein